MYESQSKLATLTCQKEHVRECLAYMIEYFTIGVQFVFLDTDWAPEIVYALLDAHRVHVPAFYLIQLSWRKYPIPPGFTLGENFTEISLGLLAIIKGAVDWLPNLFEIGFRFPEHELKLVFLPPRILCSILERDLPTHILGHSLTKAPLPNHILHYILSLSETTFRLDWFWLLQNENRKFFEPNQPIGSTAFEFALKRQLATIVVKMLPRMDLSVLPTVTWMELLQVLCINLPEIQLSNIPMLIIMHGRKSLPFFAIAKWIEEKPHEVDEPFPLRWVSFLDLAQVNEQNQTPFMYALERGFPHPESFFDKNHIEHLDVDHRSALFYAKTRRQVRFLFKAGADFSVMDKDGNSVFHQLALLQNTEIIEFVLENCEIKVNHLNKKGQTAIEYLIENSATLFNCKCVRLLANVCGYSGKLEIMYEPNVSSEDQESDDEFE
jgi:hypothetical protein